jgi:tripartite-type tricarboxylate transporter receptor subunit TctC
MITNLNGGTTMNKKLLALFLSVILILMLAACGDSAKQSATSQAPPSKSTSSAAVPAKQTYPVRSIQNVIPFGAGGGTDLWNRALMDEMSKILGQTIVSSNMTGGNSGSIGVDYVWNQPHDGYTLGGAAETTLCIPVMTGSKQTAESWSFFIAAGSPGLLCVNKNSKFKTLDEILDALKSQPESVSIGGTNGGLWFAQAQLLSHYGKVPFRWLPYEGSNPAIKGCVSNEVDCIVASAGELQDFVRAGDLVPLAVMDSESFKYMDVGTLEPITKWLPDLGPYVPLQQWLGFQVPSDTDPEILKILQDAFQKAIKSDKIKQFAEKQICVIFGLSGDEAMTFAKKIESKLCWILDDMGQTKFGPDEFAIPRP